MPLLLNNQSISKSFGADTLFENISFSIQDDTRLGLIGPNGSGKSTLLKILAGLETTDTGTTNRSSATTLAYIAQQDHFPAQHSIKTVLFGDAASTLSDEECQHRIWSVTNATVFSDLQKTVDTLSGGWQKRLAIVKALLQKPSLLLLDEPTNHLDLAGILWLEQLLKQTNIAFVLISHDRYFLDSTANTIIELNRVYPEGYFKVAGNYSEFLDKREEFLAGQLQQQQILSNKMRREQEWLNRGPKARTTKAQYRIDQAEQLKSDLKKLNYHNAQNKSTIIEFDSTERKTKILLKANSITLRRGDKLLFQNLDLMLKPGTCLGLMGENGSGKSSLLHTLNGDFQPDNGAVERADNLRIVVFDQKRMQLNKQQTLMTALAPHGDSVLYQGQTIHVAAWAKRFLFSADRLRQPVSSLSGGEQARVLIANLMLQPADILLLDEPTNDLDIATLEVLENSLREFPGAIVLITHDRFLLNRLSSQLLYLDGRGGTEFFADYHQLAQWLSHSHAKPTKASQQNDKITSAAKKIKTLSHEQQRELKRLPDKIHKAEQAVAELEAQLADPAIASDAAKLLEITEKMTLAQQKVEELYQLWQELEEQAT